MTHQRPFLLLANTIRCVCVRESCWMDGWTRPAYWGNGVSRSTRPTWFVSILSTKIWRWYHQTLNLLAPSLFCAELTATRLWMDIYQITRVILRLSKPFSLCVLMQVVVDRYVACQCRKEVSCPAVCCLSFHFSFWSFFLRAFHILYSALNFLLFHFMSVCFGVQLHFSIWSILR